MKKIKLALLSFCLGATSTVFASGSDTLGFTSFNSKAKEVLQSPVKGYVFGKNVYNDLEKHQSYTVTGSVQVEKVLFKVGRVKWSSGDSSSCIAIGLYNMDVTGLSTNGITAAPGTLGYEKCIPLYMLDTLQLFSFTVDSLVQFQSKFSVGVSFSGIAQEDTVVLQSTAKNQAIALESSWEREVNGSRISILKSWNFDASMALFPIVSESTGTPLFSTVNSTAFSYLSSSGLNWNTACSEMQVKVTDITGKIIVNRIVLKGEILPELEKKGIFFFQLTGKKGENLRGKKLLE